MRYGIDTRYKLSKIDGSKTRHQCGVRIRRTLDKLGNPGTVAEATNGRILAIVPLQPLDQTAEHPADEVLESVHIQRDAWLRLDKGRRSERRYIEPGIEGQSIMHRDGAQWMAPDSQSEFPNSKAVIEQQDETTHSVTLDVKLLRTLLDTLGADAVTLRMKPEEKKGSIDTEQRRPVFVEALVESSNTEGWEPDGALGVIMPIA